MPAVKTIFRNSGVIQGNLFDTNISDNITLHTLPINDFACRKNLVDSVANFIKLNWITEASEFTANGDILPM